MLWMDGRGRSGRTVIRSGSSFPFRAIGPLRSRSRATPTLPAVAAPYPALAAPSAGGGAVGHDRCRFLRVENNWRPAGFPRSQIASDA